MDNAHIISSHLRFDLMEICLMTKLKICALISQTVLATFLVANERYTNTDLKISLYILIHVNIMP